MLLGRKTIPTLDSLKRHHKLLQVKQSLDATEGDELKKQALKEILEQEHAVISDSLKDVHLRIKETQVSIENMNFLSMGVHLRPHSAARLK